MGINSIELSDFATNISCIIKSFPILTADELLKMLVSKK